MKSLAWLPKLAQAFRHENLGLAGCLPPPPAFRYQKLGMAGWVDPEVFAIKKFG